MAHAHVFKIIEGGFYQHDGAGVNGRKKEFLRCFFLGNDRNEIHRFFPKTAEKNLFSPPFFQKRQNFFYSLHRFSKNSRKKSILSTVFPKKQKQFSTVFQKQQKKNLFSPPFFPKTAEKNLFSASFFQKKQKEFSTVFPKTAEINYFFFCRSHLHHRKTSSSFFSEITFDREVLPKQRGLSWLLQA